jgi:hypothetical protein
MKAMYDRAKIHTVLQRKSTRKLQVRDGIPEQSREGYATQPFSTLTMEQALLVMKA